MISGNLIERAAIRLFNCEHKNTSEIAEQLKIPEERIDRIISRHLAQDHYNGKGTYDSRTKI